MTEYRQAFKVDTIARFPKSYFLENLVARADGSVLVTVPNREELWYVPAAAGAASVEPILIDTLEGPPMGIVEVEPDIFYVCIIGEAALVRYDLREWEPGLPLRQERVLAFPSSVSGLNGACLLGPSVLLIADGTAGLIWRVDLGDDGQAAKASVWLRDENMSAGWDLPAIKLTSTVTVPYPGVNGVRFGPRGNYVYYTSCARQLFVRVAVEPESLNANGPPEVIASGILSADDFCIDEAGGVAYISTHVANTIERVQLNPTTAPLARDIVAGAPFDDRLVGPSSLYWARDAEGRVAFVTSDGGHLKPGPDGVLRNSTLLRFTIEATGE